MQHQHVNAGPQLSEHISPCAECLPPSSQLVLRLQCYISVQWYALHTKTNLFSSAASWLELLHMPLSKLCFCFSVSQLSQKQQIITKMFLHKKKMISF